MRNGEVFPSLEVVPQHIHCETPRIPRSSKQGVYKIGVIISIAKGRLIAFHILTSNFIQIAKTAESSSAAEKPSAEQFVRFGKMGKNETKKRTNALFKRVRLRDIKNEQAVGICSRPGTCQCSQPERQSFTTGRNGSIPRTERWGPAREDCD